MKKMVNIFIIIILLVFFISCNNIERSKNSEETNSLTPTMELSEHTDTETNGNVEKTETIDPTVSPTEPVNISGTETPTQVETKTPTVLVNNVLKIEVDSVDNEFNIDYFSISDLVLNVYYEDGTIESINLDSSYVNIDEFKNPGVYEIVINYNEISINYSFKLYKICIVNFYCDDILIDTYEVKYGEGIENPPTPTLKYGYDGAWDILDLDLITEDLNVHAIYRENDVMKIREIVKSFYEYYNEILNEDISHNIELISEFNGASITWESDNEKVISNSGEYHRDYLSSNVTLKATLTLNEEVRECFFNVSALGYHDLSKPIVSGYLYRNYDKLTDEFFDCMDIIYCAFVTFNENGTFNTTSTLTKIKNYVIPKAHERGIYVIASLGGGDSSAAKTYVNLTANSTYLSNFSTNLVKLINEYGFDGVDFDWETPTSSNSTSFTKLAKEVYTKVKANNPHHLVTSAIGGGKWQPPRYDLSNSIKYLDYVNVMTYSMCSNSGYYQNALFAHSSYDNKTYSCGKTLVSCSIAESIDIFNSLGVSNDKLIFGLAFYGVKQTYSDGAWGNGSSVLYYNVVNNYLKNSNYEYHYDTVAQVPYILSKDGKTFISYDDRTSILAKSSYMIETKCAGLMNWEIGCDYVNYELTIAMRDGLKYQLKK